MIAPDLMAALQPLLAVFEKYSIESLPAISTSRIFWNKRLKKMV